MSRQRSRRSCRPKLRSARIPGWLQPCNYGLGKTRKTTVKLLPSGLILKIVPAPLVPPEAVVPYRYPSLASSSLPRGQIAIAGATKAVEHGVRAGGREPEHDTIVAVGSVVLCGAVEIVVGTLHQAAQRVCAVGAVGLRTECVQDRKIRAIRADPECGAVTRSRRRWCSRRRGYRRWPGGAARRLRCHQPR